MAAVAGALQRAQHGVLRQPAQVGDAERLRPRHAAVDVHRVRAAVDVRDRPVVAVVRLVRRYEAASLSVRVEGRLLGWGGWRWGELRTWKGAIRSLARDSTAFRPNGCTLMA